MALGVIKLTALQTTALATIYKDGHTHNIMPREHKALKTKGVIEWGKVDYVINADGIQCLIEAGVINEAAPVTSEVKTPAAPELSEEAVIALMLINESPKSRATLRDMTSVRVYDELYGAGLLKPEYVAAMISDTGRAYLASKGL